MKNNFLQIFLAVTAIILLLIAGAGLFWFYQTKIALPTNQPTTTPTPEEILPSPTAIPVTPTEGEEISDLEQIRQAFADKYNKPLTDVNVVIESNDNEYANGGVRFEGEIGGGWWLAAKVSGEWVIVADGNGSVLCEDIKNYSFPASMVPECWDETTNKLISL